jgi:hypothetical protein
VGEVNFLIVLGTLVSLIGCSGLSTKVSDARFFLSVAGHRSMEFETCGCTLNPMGGVVREANLAQNLYGSQPFLSLSSGNTFVPYEQPPGVTEDYLAIKRRKYAEALSSLKVSAVSPGESDFELGIEELKALQGISGAEFVSASWLGADLAPVFPEFIRRPVGQGQNLFIVGVAGPSRAKPALAKLIYRSPKEAVSSAMRSYRPDSDIVVVLHSLGEKERRALADQFPAVRFFVGSDQRDSVLGFGQWERPGTYFVGAPLRGRGIVALELQVGTSPQSLLFFEKEARSLKSNFESQSRYVAELQAGKPSAIELKKAKAFEAYLKAFPFEPSEKTLRVSSRIEMLTNQYQDPPNALSEILRSFQTQTRDLALISD